LENKHKFNSSNLFHYFYLQRFALSHLVLPIMPRFYKHDMLDSIWLKSISFVAEPFSYKVLVHNLSSAKSYKKWFLFYLIQVLNKRERRLDFYIDGKVKTENKFSLKN